MPNCSYCGDSFTTRSQLTNHQSKDRKCKVRRHRERLKILNRLQEAPSTDNVGNLPSQAHTLEPSFEPPPFEPGPAVSSAADTINTAEILDVDAETPTRHTTVEDVADSSIPERLWDEFYPPYLKAGQTIGTEKTTFERYRDDQVLQGAEVLGPFENDAEWELAKWLIKNVGHNQAEEFLKLDIVSLICQSSFQS